MYNYWEHKAILLHTKVCFPRSCQRFRLAASKDMCNLLKLNQNFVLKKFWNKIKHFFIVVKLNKYTKQFLNNSLYCLFYTDLINKSTSMANDDKLGNRQLKISYIVNSYLRDMGTGESRMQSSSLDYYWRPLSSETTRFSLETPGLIPRLNILYKKSVFRVNIVMVVINKQ